MKILITLCLGLLSFHVSAAVQLFACEPEWAALAKTIGGDQLETFSATTALQDPHRIQARPSLIAAYRRADLLICTGADLEAGWLPALARKGSNPKLLPGTPGHIEASALVELLEKPAQLDRSHGDVHPQGNPHIQTDPRKFLPVAAELAKRLGQLDPDNQSLYTANLSAFQHHWSEAIEGWESRAKPLRGLAVVSAHNGFPYLYDWLGLQRVASLEDKPGVAPSAGHLQSVLAQLQRTPATMVIAATYQDDRPARWLSEKAGIPAVILPFTVGGSETADTLQALFDVTIEQLLAAAGQKP